MSRSKANRSEPVSGVSARVVDRRFEPVDKGQCRIGSGLVAVVGDRSVDVSCGLGAQADVHLCTKTGD